MAWLILFVAGLLEVVWATAMERSDGFRHPVATGLTLVALTASMGLLALALRELPLGTAYAVWVGIGVVGTALVGMLFLGEPATPTRIGLLLLILVGVVGLRVTAEGPSGAPEHAADTP